jgi:hypothetical protein
MALQLDGFQAFEHVCLSGKADNKSHKKASTKKGFFRCSSTKKN